MKRWQMYNSIHSLKNAGFSKRQVSKKLGLDNRTVTKYLSMTPEEYEERVLKRERRTNLELYEGIVVDWLKQHPDMTAAQVYDWLQEHYQVNVAERTVRRYVEKLREKHEIPKAKEPQRQYEAIPDPPMGQQMQVDIGEIWVTEAYQRKRIKLYFTATVLSNSRYKWGEWYTRPLTTKQFVQSLQTCFEYMGGMPKQLVFDQDRLLAVDENYGDIIYTKDFEQYRLSSGFEVYLCRSADPESKGRTEAVVKYFKGNFAKNRMFMGIDIWNEEFEDWLRRTGNGKQHNITKKVPAEVFEQERLFLKPIPSTKKYMHEDTITRYVHKNNTIFYEGNRYSVPFGTYEPGLQVCLKVEEGRLIISNEFGDYVIAEHELSKNKGELVVNNNHKRDTSERINDLQASLLTRFNGSEDAELFLGRIRTLKSRYTRDQFALIGKTLDKYRNTVIDSALKYCITHSLYSAVEFKNAAEYYDSRREPEHEEICENPHVIDFTTAAAFSKKRALSAYDQAAKGGGE